MTTENKRWLCDGIGALCVGLLLFMLPILAAWVR